MNPSLHSDILRRLEPFEFRRVGDWLREGKCPNCGKKKLYTHGETPWVIRCDRESKCGYSAHVRDLFPEVFTNWSDRFPIIPEQNNPNATADAYLRHARGFDVSAMASWYTQDSYYDNNLKAGSATVRFPVGNGYWERLIDQPERFERKAKFSYGMQAKGEWWAPPPLDLATLKEIWLVEGIFDAIALWQNDIPAVSIMSSNNYPEKLLEELNTLSGKDCKLIWALDGDKAGRSYTLRWIRRAEEDGWTCEAMQIPQEGKDKLDWNDMLLKERLKPADLEDYRYYGALLTAKSAAEKGLLLYKRDNGRTGFHFDFRNRLFWFSLDLDAFDKALDMLDKNGEAESMSEEERRDSALMTAKAVQPIANCLPTPLYFQKNHVTGESWYYFRVDFPHGASVKDAVTPAQISAASDFKKRLLGIAAGAMYTGNGAQLDRFLGKELENLKTVETIDYIGYSLEHGCYVLGDVAVKDGKLNEVNQEDFFEFGKLSLKSLNRSATLKINASREDYRKNWVNVLWQAFGAKGLAALTFWFGTLFSEQIRALHGFYPFLEIVGEAGAGKSTLIEFMWKLFGRQDYEGFDPSKSTHAARARNFAQVSGLPVVLIESDRERIDGEKSNVKSFDWDELKTAFNGRSVRARGVATSGNETYEPPFRGAIVISQNNPVSASEAILSRIVHLNFDRSEQTRDSGNAADTMKSLGVSEVSGFILAAATREKQVMETVKAKQPDYLAELRGDARITMDRLAQTHAQMLALSDALADVVKLTEAQHAALQKQIRTMAVERQQAINADHQLVQEFWEAFDYLDGPDMPLLNHSRDLSIIAVNLNHFIQFAAEKRQQVPPLRELKKVLKTSRKRKFQGVKTVNSRLLNRDDSTGSKSIKCWVFQDEGGSAK